MIVYGGNLDGRHRAIVCSKYKSHAAKALGISISYFNDYFCETGDQEEVLIAESDPGQAYKAIDNSRPYKVWEKIS